MMQTALLSLGTAAVLVEFEIEPSEPPADDCPGSPATASITAVRIGQSIVDDPESCFSEWQMQRWEEQILAEA